MSGPMPRAVAVAASEAAIRAEALASARKWAPQALAAAGRNAAKNAERDRQSLPAKVWADIGPQVRTALVMLSLDTPGDPRAIARQPWESFNDSDRAALAATARQFHAELKHANCLW